MPIRILLLSMCLAMVALPAGADEQETAGQFLARCQRPDPACRSEYEAGLQAVNEGQLACPPRIDVNAPITPWLDTMRRLVAEKPGLADGDKNILQLEAFMRLWPCPAK
ncbi:hypothetical protein [Mesorhizobium shangrilense]|uniref:Rap1a immunity protein domain-containing protein n=1 Tax=Mesorhizobium shangrilense TaxID=460060 RepID=A0ABV2D634_9HYPH